MEPGLRIELVQQDGYRFEARFDQPSVPALLTDEPPPLGAGSGPNPARLLTVAVANCLSASLLFAMRKFRNEPGPLHTTATASIARNEAGRWRIARIAVEIRLGVPAAGLSQLERVLAQYEDFCIVTQSVRAGIPVDVRVVDSQGVTLAPAAPAA